MNQIVNMIIRIFMRKAINSGIKAGMNAMSGSQQKPRSNRDQDAQQMVSDDANARRRQPNAKGMSGQARQISRITRRLTRF